MHDDHGFTWISLVPGLAHAPSHVVMAIAVSVVLVLTTFVARAQLVRVMRSPSRMTKSRMPRFSSSSSSTDTLER